MPFTTVTDAPYLAIASILGLLVSSGLTPTRNEARRAVEQGGVSVNDEKVTDVKTLYAPEDLGGDGIVLRRGKKSYKRIKF